jgi:hypothetical protein
MEEVAAATAAMPTASEVTLDNNLTAQPDSTPESTADEAQAEKQTKTFTQDELDAIVKKRLAKESRRIERVAALEAENRMLRERMQPPPQERTNQPPSGAPRPEQFQDYESYVEALTDWKVDQKLTAQQQRAAQERAARDAQEQSAKVREKLSAASSKYEDFEDVALSPDTPITQAMAHAIIESDVSADLAYYLGTHVDEAAQIARMSPVGQVRALAKLEEKLTASAPTSKAPKPISPIGGKSSPRDGLADDLPIAEWMKRRNAQLKSR